MKISSELIIPVVAAFACLLAGCPFSDEGLLTTSPALENSGSVEDNSSVPEDQSTFLINPVSPADLAIDTSKIKTGIEDGNQGIVTGDRHFIEVPRHDVVSAKIELPVVNPEASCDKVTFSVTLDGESCAGKDHCVVEVPNDQLVEYTIMLSPADARIRTDFGTFAQFNDATLPDAAARTIKLVVKPALMYGDIQHLSLMPRTENCLSDPNGAWWITLVPPK